MKRQRCPHCGKLISMMSDFVLSSCINKGEYHATIPSYYKKLKVKKISIDWEE